MHPKRKIHTNILKAKHKNYGPREIDANHKLADKMDKLKTLRAGKALKENRKFIRLKAHTKLPPQMPKSLMKNKIKKSWSK